MRRTLVMVALLLAVLSTSVPPAHAAMVRGGVQATDGELPPPPQDPWYIRLKKAFFGDGTPSKWHNAVTIARLTGR